MFPRQILYQTLVFLLPCHLDYCHTFRYDDATETLEAVKLSLKKISPLRIELNYMGVQSTFWLSNLAYAGFTAVFLAAKGLSDTQIGFTSSLLSMLSIAFQLFTSNFSDLHQHIPIKHVMTALLLFAMVCGTLITAVPLSIPLLILVFSLGAGFQNANVGLMNAQIMQYANAGIPVNFGWPRGIGSLIYAVAAYFLGIQLEIHSPSILMPLFLIMAAITIVVVLFMPNVHEVGHRRASLYVQEKHSERTTYRQMLSQNRVLTLFLLASVILYFGQGPVMLFLVRVVQGAGGGGKELGISMLLQSGIEMPAMLMAPWLIKKIKPHYLLLFSFVMYVIKMVMLYLAQSMPVIYIAMVSSIFCYGLYGVASAYFVNNIVKSGEKVRAQGLVVLCGNLGGILGNLLGGYIMDVAGLKTLLNISWMIVLASAIIMLACALAQNKVERVAAGLPQN